MSKVLNFEKCRVWIPSHQACKTVCTLLLMLMLLVLSLASPGLVFFFFVVVVKAYCINFMLANHGSKRKTVLSSAAQCYEGSRKIQRV